MLHVAIAAFILTLIYRLLDKRYGKNDVHHVEIDWYVGVAAVITSWVAVALTGMLVVSFELPGLVYLASFAFYILIPFGIFKLLLDYKVKLAIIYSLWVPFVVFLTKVPFVLVNGPAG